MSTSNYLRPAALTAAGLLIALSSCIKNDIPYPRIQPNITEFEVEGQLRAALIDSASRTVTVAVSEDVDIQALEVKAFAFAPADAVANPDPSGQKVNLSQPLEIEMSLYQDYVWTVTATQDILRTFTVRDQIGASVIDPETHTVTANIPTTVPLDQVFVEQLKLGGSHSVISPALVGQTVDFTAPVTVSVSEFGRTQDWTITVSQTELAVNITAADAWTEVAWIHASIRAGLSVGLQYRELYTASWQTVPQADVTIDGGELTACIKHLRPETEYEVRAISPNEVTPTVKFTTGSIVQPQNAGLQDWWLDGKIWCPWAKDGDPYWGTGNKGATTLGDSNTAPMTDASSPTGYAGARLETRFVGIGLLGKLAAGNIFAGTYVRTDGTNGILSMGRPFGQRPTRVRATVKYTSTTISHSNSEMAHLKGRPDTCTVWCALIDSDEPFEIRTNPNNRQLFERTDPCVVAYGIYQSGDSDDDYTTVDFPLEYVSTSRVPKYMLLTASASKYGDFFTGGNGSLLLVKDFELMYDYTDN